MEKRIDTISNKCKVFYLAKCHKFEEEGKTLPQLFRYLQQSQGELYDYLRGRFSGKVSREDLIANYINPRGLYHEKYLSLKMQLMNIEKFDLTKFKIKYISGSGWSHFLINEEINKENSSDERTSLKTYIAVDYETFTSEVFERVLINLSRNNFSGQIKIPQPEAVAMFYLQNDNVVIHSKDKVNLELGTRIVLSTLESEGVKLGGSSYDTDVTGAQDIRIPDLLRLKIKSKKTSFSEGMSMLACESLLLSIEKNKTSLNYKSLKVLISELFRSSGSFDTYIKTNYDR